MNEAIVTKLDKIRNLPTIPSAIQNLRTAIANPKADAHKISTIIENDPAMMSRILKIVNSAFYGGIEPITSVQHAVARIGFSAINNIALSTFVFSSFTSTHTNIFDRAAFWKHCITTGIASEIIFNQCRKKISRRFAPDLLHLTGLLHDIGKIVLEQYFHSEFSNALHTARCEAIPLHEAERKTMGTDHCEIGGWLANKWKLDPQIESVVRFHHNPSAAAPENYDLCALCHIANHICNTAHLGDGGDSASPSTLPDIWKHLDIRETEAANIALVVANEADKLNTMLSLA
jgi:putative nucleotidyltransferase with HDIG domain